MRISHNEISLDFNIYYYQYRFLSKKVNYSSKTPILFNCFIKSLKFSKYQWIMDNIRNID